jgi:hypothetical protein
VPDLQGANESERSDCRNSDHVDSLDGDDDRALAGAIGGQPAHQHEGDEASAQAGRDERQRRGVVVEFDDLKGHHDGPHAFGEDRQRDRGDQQAVLADLEGCEHAPTAGVDHRLFNVFNVELRAHQSMVAERRVHSPPIFRLEQVIEGRDRLPVGQLLNNPLVQ